MRNNTVFWKLQVISGMIILACLLPTAHGSFDIASNSEEWFVCDATQNAPQFGELQSTDDNYLHLWDTVRDPEGGSAAGYPLCEDYCQDSWTDPDPDDPLIFYGSNMCSVCEPDGNNIPCCTDNWCDTSDRLLSGNPCTDADANDVCDVCEVSGAGQPGSGEIPEDDCIDPSDPDCIGGGGGSGDATCEELTDTHPPEICDEQEPICLGGTRILSIEHIQDSDLWCCDGGTCVSTEDRTCLELEGNVCDLSYEFCPADEIIDGTQGLQEGQVCCESACLPIVTQTINPATICYERSFNDYFGECCVGDYCFNINDKPIDINTFASGNMLFAISTFDAKGAFDEIGGNIVGGVFRSMSLDGGFQLQDSSNEQFRRITQNNLMPLKSDWAQFDYLEFDMAYRTRINTLQVLDAQDHILCEYGPGDESNPESPALHTYSTTGDVALKWHHFKIPICDEAKNAPVKRAVLYGFEGDPSQRGYVVDNVFLSVTQDRAASYENYYCAGAYNEWVTDLDGPNPQVFTPEEDLPHMVACNEQLAFGWTGNRCCGDDSQVLPTPSKEYFSDTFSGCWAGRVVENNKRVSDAIGIPGRYKNIMFLADTEEPGFYRCGTAPLTPDISDLNTDPQISDPDFLSSLGDTEPYCDVKGTYFCSYDDAWDNTPVFDEDGNALAPGSDRDRQKGDINIFDTDGFEDDASRWSGFIGASIGSEGCDVDNAACMKLNAGGNAWGFLYPRQTTLGTGGYQVTLRFKANAGEQVRIFVYEDQNAIRLSQTVIGNDGWQEVTYPFTLQTGNMVTVSVQQMGNAHDAFVDDLYVYPLDPDDAVTDTCCPQNYCGFGDQCLQDESLKFETPDSKYVCDQGIWRFQGRMSDPDGNSGFCDGESMCYWGFSNEIGDGECVGSGDYRSEYLCEGGEWTSRVKNIYLALSDFAQTNYINNYMIYCDPRMDISHKAIGGYQDQPSRYSSCVLVHDDAQDDIIVGVAVGIPLASFLDTQLHLDQDACAGAGADDDDFDSCNVNNHPVIESLYWLDGQDIVLFSNNNFNYQNHQVSTTDPISTFPLVQGYIDNPDGNPLTELNELIGESRYFNYILRLQRPDKQVKMLFESPRNYHPSRGGPAGDFGFVVPDSYLSLQYHDGDFAQVCPTIYEEFFTWEDLFSCMTRYSDQDSDTLSGNPADSAILYSAVTGSMSDFARCAYSEGYHTSEVPDASYEQYREEELGIAFRGGELHKKPASMGCCAQNDCWDGDNCVVTGETSGSAMCSQGSWIEAAYCMIPAGTNKFFDHDNVWKFAAINGAQRAELPDIELPQIAGSRNTNKTFVNILNNPGFQFNTQDTHDLDDYGPDSWAREPVSAPWDEMWWSYGGGADRVIKLTLPTREIHYVEDIDVTPNTDYALSVDLVGGTCGQLRISLGNALLTSDEIGQEQGRHTIIFSTGNRRALHDLNLKCSSAGNPTYAYLDNIQLEPLPAASTFQSPGSYLGISCCPDDYCWKGDRCVPGAEQQFSFNIETATDDDPNSIFAMAGSANPPPETGYACLRGTPDTPAASHADWDMIYRRESWDGESYGYCVDKDSCWNGLTCVESGDADLASDNYCAPGLDGGVWASRTSLVAAKLAQIAARDGSSDFAIDCGPAEEILATDMAGVDLTDVNNVCVVRYGITDGDQPEKTIFAASYNAPGGNTQEQVISVTEDLLDSGAVTCPGFDSETEDVFTSCRINRPAGEGNWLDNLYVSKNSAVFLFSEQPLDSWMLIENPSWVQNFAYYIMNPFRFIQQSFTPDIEVDVPQRFEALYLSRFQSDSGRIKAISSVQENGDLMLQYGNTTSGLCTRITDFANSDDNFDLVENVECAHIPDDYVDSLRGISQAGRSAIGEYAKDFTSKTRLQNNDCDENPDLEGCPPRGVGAECSDDDQCITNYCREGFCYQPHELLEECAIGDDCLSGYCEPTINVCFPPGATVCNDASECDNGRCSYGRINGASFSRQFCGSCSDGIWSYDERYIDCGGMCPLDGTCTLPAGAYCEFPSECLSDLCQDNICMDNQCDEEFCIPTPTCNDEMRNGDEEGIDCGGSCPIPCDFGGLPGGIA